MSKVISNERIDEDFFLLKVEDQKLSKIGQFYMLRAWDSYPTLSRPISVYDSDDNSVSFLVKIVGEGTEILSELKKGDDIEITGPLGKGFPEDISGKIALVGGGVGIAPLFKSAKEYKNNPNNTVDVYLGFSGTPILEEEYKKICDNLIVNVGGFITDDIDTTKYDYILTCGPEIMMQVLYKKCKEEKTDDRLYVSMENRMACGFGACLVCTCKTNHGNKKVCKDGPVFLANEVWGE
ncbi:dihydroorotate dehydrogenase electron transfer subunit [Eubacterium uniforme]|uniref:Dihydroorotate dehydrogenase electron transfer subunit n=1 Tax=Eubacterium uniforme TaxID=39495 RepID=A0A1T4VSV5_9FIRM|nr:dihydroorotate dehydrogenase electron transfer subunit [Eubacterium uniforme]SKA68070.1 dihydroorotate dehydrogenase electron transfer subunit [Eubacterium uniforme]